jgi:hypothetical protein
VYLALYGLEGLVIFDHPHNAEYELAVCLTAVSWLARRTPITARRGRATPTPRSPSKSRDLKGRHIVW